jgi:hypothetical protein
MGLLKLLGINTAHEGQHKPGKHAKGGVKKAKPVRESQKGSGKSK